MGKQEESKDDNAQVSECENVHHRRDNQLDQHLDRHSGCIEQLCFCLLFWRCYFRINPRHWLYSLSIQSFSVPPDKRNRPSNYAVTHSFHVIWSSLIANHFTSLDRRSNGLLRIVIWYLPTFRHNISVQYSIGTWPLKMGTIWCQENSVNTDLQCVTSKERDVLIYTMMDTWNHAFYYFRLYGLINAVSTSPSKP